MGLIVVVLVSLERDLVAENAIDRNQSEQRLAESFDGLFDEWENIKAGIERVIIESEQEISRDRRNQLTKILSDLQNSARELAPKVTAAAKAQWILDPDTSGTSQAWLYSRFSVCATTGSEVEALDCVSALLTHKNHLHATKLEKLYRAATICAFRMNDFDLANDYLDALASLAPLDRGMIELRKSVTHAKQKWKKEQELRAKAKASGDLPRIELRTAHGAITLELFENDCPDAVAGFVRLVEEKFYDGCGLYCDDARNRVEARSVRHTGVWIESVQSVESVTNRRDEFRGSLSIPSVNQTLDFTRLALTRCFPLTEDKDEITIGRVVHGIEIVDILARSKSKHDQTCGQINGMRFEKQP